MVRVLDDESIHHSNRRRRAQTVTLGCTTFSILPFRWTKTTRLHWWAQCRAGTHRLPATGAIICLFSACWRRRFAVVFLLNGSLALIRAAVHVVGHLFTLAELHCREVEHQHVIKFLRELKDASEDIHFVVICNGCVTTSGKRTKISILNLNLTPGSCTNIELPKIVQLIVVIVLSAKHVQFSVMDSRRCGCARFRALLSGLTLWADGGLDGLSARGMETAQFVHTWTVDKSSKDQEDVFTEITHYMVITWQHLLGGILNKEVSHYEESRAMLPDSKLLTEKVTFSQLFVAGLNEKISALLSSPLRPPYIITSLEGITEAVWCEIRPGPLPVV